MSSDDPQSPRVQPLLKAKKRGAISNLQSRYETLAREAIDDGWFRDNTGEADAEHHTGGYGPSALKTQVIEEQAKSILSRNQSPDVPFSVSLNPYRGCERGCIYCFARPTHSYLGLSPGLDFQRKIFAKINAPELLRRELAKTSYVPEPIALGVNTDAYQPCERDLLLTRRIVEVLHACEHPVVLLITKSSLIKRDIDLLAEMASRRQAAEASAINASYVVLRLPWEVSPLFR